MMWYSETQSVRTERFSSSTPLFPGRIRHENESDLPFPVVANWQGPIVFGALVTDRVTVSRTSAMSRGYV